MKSGGNCFYCNNVYSATGMSKHLLNCIEEGAGLLCSHCAKKHECGEDVQLPVVNSPRMGMCGYTGLEN